eukprot:57418-Chlamydomonas_euryale.AAC.1
MVAQSAYAACACRGSVHNSSLQGARARAAGSSTQVQRLHTYACHPHLPASTPECAPAAPRTGVAAPHPTRLRSSAPPLAPPTEA